jgi:hypothetical protein
MDTQTLELLAEFICGDDDKKFPSYRSSMYLSRFFENAGLPRFKHDGSTRKWWVLESLKQCNPDEIRKVIARLANPREYRADKALVRLALTSLNEIVLLEGLKVELSGPNPIIKPVTASFNMDDEPQEERKLAPLPPPDFANLKLPLGLDVIMVQRWNEAELCIEHEAYLMATVAMGGLLEGILLGALLNEPRQVNTSTTSPKDKEGKVKAFSNWSLSEMIDVAHDIGWIDLDVKRFSHSLREFRNLIHPFEQNLHKANPDGDTCRISWLVVQSAVNDLARTLE